MSLHIEVSRLPLTPPFATAPKENWWAWEVSERGTVRISGWSRGRRIAAFRAARRAIKRFEFLASGEAEYRVFTLNSQADG